MKTLILSDATYSQLERALSETARGSEVLEAFGQAPQLPSDRELVALSRQGADAPEAITRARENRDAGVQAAEDTRLAMNDLIVHCYTAGVRPVDLSRWFGLHITRIYEIIRPLTGK